MRFGEEHQHDHPDVEVGGDRAGHHTDDDQRHRPAAGRCLEHRELADEPAGQRNTGERQQEHRKEQADNGIALPQPGPVRQGGVLVTVGVTDQAHDRERSHSAEAVGDEVEHRRRETDRVVRDHTGEDETDVRDRRVGQHPLDVGLGHRRDGADRHGQDRDGPQHWSPLVLQRRQRHVEHSQQRAERGHFGGCGHEPGDRSRRTLVDVGNPRMERNGADLEQQPDRQQRNAEQRRRMFLLAG